MSDAGATKSVEQLFVQVGGHFVELAIHLYEPAGQSRGTAYCLHDYAGNGNDFERLATVLVAQGLRVVCPDLPGRGGSARLADPAGYRPRPLLGVLMQVMNKYAGPHVSIIAKGWGAVLALLLVNSTRFELRRLVLSDLPLRYRPDRLMLPPEELLGHVFTDLDAARNAVLAMPELAGLTGVAAQRLADGRMLRTEGGSVLAFDPALVDAVAPYFEHTFNIAVLIRRLRMPVLRMAADPIDEAEAAAIRTLKESAPDLIQTDGLVPGGRIHFTTATEQLLVLGFLGGRVAGLF